LTNPQTWNRYAYVNNNPLRLVDSLGLDVDFCGTRDASCGVGSIDGGGSLDSGGGSDGGGDAGSGGGCDPNADPMCGDNSGLPPDTPPNLDVSALGDCISNVYPGTILLDATPTVGLGARGENPDPGNVNGTATFAFTGLGYGAIGTITNDIQSMGELAMNSVTSYAYANPGPYSAVGKTDSANPWTNYTENGTVGQAAIDTQVLELGNSIYDIENGPPARGSLTDPSQDPGGALFNCYTNATGASPSQ
jgi:hypothetical protein